MLKFLSLFNRGSVKTEEIKNISPEYLEKKRLSMDKKSYLKFLKKNSGTIELNIINMAETNGQRDEDLENKLRLLTNEIEKFFK